MMSAILMGAVLAGAGSGTGEIELRFERLRNTRGSLHLCLMRDGSRFPDCAKDPQAIKRTVPAASAGEAVRFAGVAAGTYAVTVLHDENVNGRLDTVLGIPREGFGFSRNPVVRFGPPSFEAVRFQLDGPITRLTIRMQYLL